MAQYNLTDNTKDSFTFSIGNGDKALEYSFRYPTTAELRELSRMNNKLQEMAEAKASDEDIEKQSKATEEEMNKLVTPVGHEATISAVLESQPINVVRNFRQMMAKEISLG